MSHRIERLFASFQAPETLEEVLTTKARIIGVREKSDPVLPIYGTYYGPAGFEEFLSRLRTAFDTRAFHVDHILEGTDIGYASGRFEHHVRATGQLFRSHWALRCRFEGEKISEYRFYEDTAALEESLGMRSRCSEEI